MNEANVKMTFFYPHPVTTVCQGNLEDIYAYAEQVAKTDALVFKTPIVYLFEIKQEGYYDAITEMMEYRKENGND